MPLLACDHIVIAPGQSIESGQPAKWRRWKHRVAEKKKNISWTPFGRSKESAVSWSLYNLDQCLVSHFVALQMGSYVIVLVLIVLHLLAVQFPGDGGEIHRPLQPSTSQRIDGFKLRET